MSKGKKAKINKMEKLRQILDNPYEPKIKKLISKDDKNLELVRRKLSGESSISKNHTSSEFLAKKSDSLKPKVAIRQKEEKITPPEIRKLEPDERIKDVKGESPKEDLYEVKKTDVSKPEFLKVKTKEVSKETPPEKIIRKETPPLDRKDKMVVFQEIGTDKIYRETRRGIPYSDKIQMYRPITIIEIWAFTLILGVVAISGLFLMRDWLFLNFGVYGDKFIPTPAATQNIHIWFGFAFAILGLFHLAIHIFSKKKDILPKQALRDFKAFLHSGMYLIGLSRREGYGTSGRFYGRQRIIYLALVYILGLTALTGFLYYLNFLSEDLVIVHVIPAGLSIMVLLFHFLITIRKHDTIALKGAFVTGKLPRWYVRKNHPIWYEKMRGERESTLEELPDSTTARTNKTMIEGGNRLTNAVFKFALLFNACPDEEDIKDITKELQITIPLDELERIIELAEGLKDEPEEESKQDAKEESQ